MLCRLTMKSFWNVQIRLLNIHGYLVVLWHMYGCVILCMAFAVVFVSARTPPEFFPKHMRGGMAYRMAQDHHTRSMLVFGQEPNTTVNYLQQLVNHSEPHGPTFAQRWYVDYSHYTSPRGILYISGEQSATRSPTGYMQVYGYDIGAALFTLEHRFYGQSLPFALTNTSGLRYLSVDAALDDLNAFMTYVETTVLNRNLTWIVVGGSYAGALSAWFKAKFPSRAVASWSSSGVVDAIFNFYDYDGHAMEVLSSECQTVIQRVMLISEALWSNGSESILRNIFASPSYFIKGDVFYMLADSVAGAVQYGMKTDFCDTLLAAAASTDGEPISDVALLTAYNTTITTVWGPQFSSSCYYSTHCLTTKDMSQYWAAVPYGWLYQTCAELAYWQVSFSGGLRNPSVSTEYFETQCRMAFGDGTFPDTFRFNAIKGGKNPPASNVIALQGSDDPWQTAGVTTPLGPNYPSVMAQCHGCGHCGDLAYPQSDDPPSLHEQRDAIRSYLNAFLETSFMLYSVTLQGNFSFLNAATFAADMQQLTTALQSDLQVAVDRSALTNAPGATCNTAKSSLSVPFTVGLTQFNVALVPGALQGAFLSSTWLTATDTVYRSLGGTGNVTVLYITPQAPSASLAKCSTGCIAGIIVGVFALVGVIAAVVIVVLRRRRRQSGEDPLLNGQTKVE